MDSTSAARGSDRRSHSRCTMQRPPLKPLLPASSLQTIRDIRIIIVNDGSTDRTQDILNKIAKADERVQVLTTLNGGIVSALNAGSQICSAEFVARHDADDLAYPQPF